MAAWTRDRIVPIGGLIAAIAFVWLYLAHMNMPPEVAGVICTATPRMLGAPWQHFAAALLLWIAMTLAMMLPTALPAIDVFGSFARKRKGTIGSAPRTFLFALGYVVLWTACSVFAAAGQIALSRASLLAPSLQSTSVVLSATILLFAGAFQFTALKDACLTQCRSPFPFFLANWRDGNWGAFMLGIEHGSYCVGCCWALMGLMFVFGAMNLIWMGALSLFMLGEKIAPARWRLDRGAGVVLITWGLFVATRLLH